MESSDDEVSRSDAQLLRSAKKYVPYLWHYDKKRRAEHRTQIANERTNQVTFDAAPEMIAAAGEMVAAANKFATKTQPMIFAKMSLPLRQRAQKPSLLADLPENRVNKGKGNGKTV